MPRLFPEFSMGRDYDVRLGCFYYPHKHIRGGFKEQNLYRLLMAISCIPGFADVNIKTAADDYYRTKNSLLIWQFIEKPISKYEGPN